MKALVNSATREDVTHVIVDGKLVIEAKEERGSMVIPAETSGDMSIAVAGNYLIKALRACGGIVDMKLASQQSPITFTVDGYRCLVMPMAIPENKAVAEAEAVAQEAETEANSKRESQVKTRKPVVKSKAQEKEPVAVG